MGLKDLFKRKTQAEKLEELKMKAKLEDEKLKIQEKKLEQKRNIMKIKGEILEKRQKGMDGSFLGGASKGLMGGINAVAGFTGGPGFTEPQMQQPQQSKGKKKGQQKPPQMVFGSQGFSW